MLAMDIQVMSTWAGPAAMPWDIEAAARMATAVPDRDFFIIPPIKTQFFATEDTENTEERQEQENKLGKNLSLAHDPSQRNLAAQVCKQLPRLYPQSAFPRFLFFLCVL